MLMVDWILFMNKDLEGESVSNRIVQLIVDILFHKNMLSGAKLNIFYSQPID